MERRAIRRRAKATRQGGELARRSFDAAPERAQSLDPAQLLAQLKSGAPAPIGPAGMVALQRTLGNRTVQRLIDPATRKTWLRRRTDEVDELPANSAPGLFGNVGRAIQRHWLEGEEEVQALHDPAMARGRSRAFGDPWHHQRRASERAHRGTLLWRNPAALVQRDDGKAGGTVAVKGDVGAAKGAAAPAGKVDAVTLPAGDVPADGKATVQAKATTSGGASVSKWSILGESYGSTIDTNGLVTAGTDLKGAESVTIKVQATDEKGGASGMGLVTLWDATLLKAKIDYPKFVGATHTYPNFTVGLNGKFDLEYNPASKVANANMKLKFAWPEEKVEAPAPANLWGFASKMKHIGYMANFIGQVTKQWSGRYEFNNVREPKIIWGKLNPVTVKVNVIPVEADQHFTVEVRDRASKAREQTAVRGGVLTLYQGDDVPHPAFNPSTGAGELTRVNRVTPTPIQFANNSTAVPADAAAKLGTMGTYISRINNPKFDIQVVGHACATGDSKKNQELSEKRAQAVVDILNGTGATNHTIKASGVGDAGAGKTADWRKVEITTALPAGWTNMQDTTAHEFGHMIGLGDEYAAAGKPKSTHYDLVAKAFGKDYAEQVAKRGDTDYASIMEGGNDVRIQHYVTFWSALVETTLKAADPDPKFGYDDWKFAGT